jgi:hypothetical protein
MFTAENFRRIFDGENRNGLDLARRFFPNLVPHTKSIKEKVGEIRALRSKKATLGPKEFADMIGSLQAELVSLKRRKSDAVDSELQAISAKVLKPSFKLSLTQKIPPTGKPFFCIDGTPETFFVVKQLQRNVGRIFSVKQSSRQDLVCQLRDTLTAPFPYEVVRTDVTSFYESIDRKKLLNWLNEEQLLSSSSKKYIKQILDSYGSAAETSIGIPRGVGISAYLAELYLRPIDREISNIEGLVLYCRFVDDIVAVFGRPPTGPALGSYKELIVHKLEGRGLTHNSAKTTEVNLGSPGAKTLEYLGYRFTLINGACAIAPSITKIAKLTSRLHAAFDDYELRSSVSSRRAFRDLVSRVKFLTGNTRLLNSKASAVTGIYYNNSIVTDVSDFITLDAILKSRVNAIKRPTLRKRLEPYSFTDGFTHRRYHSFSTTELVNIVEAWKHV